MENYEDKLIGYNGSIKEKINIYYFNKERNKCILKGKSVSVLKNKLIEKYGLKCSQCDRTIYSPHQLELEHYIPVEIGGRIFCLSNLNLICVKCHRKKTTIDKKVIKIIKDCGFLFDNNSFVTLEELRKLYLYWFKIINDNKERYEKWSYGSNGVDYEQVNDLSNREDIKDGEKRKEN